MNHGIDSIPGTDGMLFKRSVSLLPALFISIILSACGGGGSSDSDPSGDNATDDTSLDEGQPSDDTAQDPVDEGQPSADDPTDPDQDTPPATDDTPTPEPEPVPESPANTPPMVDIQGDAEVSSGATLVLDGSASSDPDGDTLTYQWTQSFGEPLNLVAVNGPTLTLIAPDVSESSLLGVQLSVSDGTDSVSLGFQFTVVPPADTTAPGIEAQSPQPGAVDVATNTQVWVRFNEPLDSDLLPDSSLQLMQSGNPVSGSLGYDSDTHTLTFTPDAALEATTLYTVALSDDPRDLSGNPVSTDSWQFTTGSAYNLGATTQQTMDQCMSVQDKEMLTLVNNARAVARQCGDTSYPAVPALAWHCDLETAAQGHSDSMAQNDFFSHTGLDNSSPGDRITAAGYIWRAYGENIAAGYATAEDAMTGWLNSPGHCANLMSSLMTEIGTGVAENPSAQYRIYWTQDFADR
jgi:uncharacterized protein YkwD